MSSIGDQHSALQSPRPIDPDSKVYYHSPDMETLQQPKPLSFSFFDQLRALYNWLRVFRTATSIEPGLYYTGKEYDRNAPLIVSCN